MSDPSGRGARCSALARYWHEREFETVSRVNEIAGQRGISRPPLSIAWMLANPCITPILGVTRVEQLTDTIAAVDVKLDKDVKAKLDDVSIEYRRGDAEC